MNRTLFVVFSLMLLTGCALQKPLSEGLIFEQPPQRQSGITSAAASINSAALSPALRRYARDRYDVGESGAGLTEPLTYGLAYSIGFDPAARTRVGLSAGALFLGIDATTEVLPRTYLTGSANTARSAEVILQRRLYQNRGIGVSLGTFFRSERRGWSYECREGYCLGVVPDEEVRLNAFGLRSAFRARAGSVDPSGFVSAGYAPLLEDVVFMFGISFGI